MSGSNSEEHVRINGEFKPVAALQMDSIPDAIEAFSTPNVPTYLVFTGY